MICDYSHFQAYRHLLFPGSRATPMTGSQYAKTSPNSRMFVSPWYLDEFGNPTREIKAFDLPASSKRKAPAMEPGLEY